jgi:hypothetical protein
MGDGVNAATTGMSGTTGWAGGGPDGPDAGLLSAVLRFVHRLRDASVPVSMVETIDAMNALQVVDLADRGALRAALRSTLVKRAEHASTFESLFDISFVPTRSKAVTAEPTSANDETGAGRGAAPAGLTGSAGAQDGSASTALMETLLEAMRSGDPDRMAALAAEAVDRYAGIRADRTAGERYYLYRVLRQLDLWALLQRAVQQDREGEGAGARTPLEDRLGRDDQLRRMEEFRRLIAQEIRRRLAQAKGAQHAARAFRDVPIEDVDFLSASPTELREMRDAIRPLARKLAARIARRRRVRHRGRLDVRRTVRRSLSSGGVPIEPAFRRPRASKPDLYILADISRSVAEFARFTVSLLQALKGEFSKVRLFVFVDGIDEVTAIFEEDADLAPRNLLFRTDAVAADGHSDYGSVFASFWDRYGHASLDPRATVIITGDARNNYRDPGDAALRAIRDRARRIYWLNPEPRAEWDTTDSVMGLYAPRCHGVFEVRNLRQLADFVFDIA